MFIVTLSLFLNSIGMPEQVSTEGCIDIVSSLHFC
jgi:hypothetical protein